MRAVVQRVSRASVVVDGETVGEIGKGLLVYLGVVKGDGAGDGAYLVDKIRHLRVFPDERAGMNRSVSDTGGGVLVVSAFTTGADARKGRRPSLDHAAHPAEAEPLYEMVCDALGAGGLPVQRGRFGAMMDVSAVNDGPVCILLDSRRRF